MNKNYSELTIRDPFIFGKVTTDPTVSQKLISSLLDEDIQVISEPEIEKYIRTRKDGKYVKLDLFILDDKNRLINAEMQNKSKDKQVQCDLPVRTRVYQSMIDSEVIKFGLKYKEVKECIIIFICNFDLFGQGKYKYTFRNRCEENPEIVLNDRCTKIFYNTTADLSEVPEKTKNLLTYIEKGEVKDDVTKDLEAAVQSARENEEWGREYMLTFVREYDVYNEGVEEGLERGRKVLAETIEKLRSGKNEEELRSEGVDEDTIELAKKLM